MPVRLAPKGEKREPAIVPDEVVQLITKARAERKAGLLDEARTLKVQLTKSSDRWAQKANEKKLEIIKHQIVQLATQEDGDILSGVVRGGMDELLFRMKRLPFVRFDVKSRNSKPSGRSQNWIIGLTKDVFTILGGRGRSNPAKKYYHGKYYIAILTEALGSTNPIFHLLPQRDPTTPARHMHHHSRGSSARNPLDASPNTCYGGFSGVIMGAFRSADVPELFRVLHMFTERLNPSSPLIRLPNLNHIQQVKSDG